MNDLDVSRHPCFNVHAKGTCGRVHLPVARDCNIRCNYCNRKYDCVNESRPGITSAVLEPAQAVRYLEEVLSRSKAITVAGIAGPGDAFANPERTLSTLAQVRERFPGILLCLATNGLNVEPYVEELARLKVSHVTVTVNAVDPEIGAKIYSWVRDGRIVNRGLKAAELLLERQERAIVALKRAGVIVKVNTIVIQGINDHHVLDVARRMRALGADIQNCMAMYPNEGTPFQDIPELSPDRMSAIQARAEKELSQMKHCTRCRADAVGLLDQDRSEELQNVLVACSTSCGSPSRKPYVAVATLEGALVNLHLGEAPEFQIWEQCEEGYRLMGVRPAPEPGTGTARWLELATRLQDCRAILVSSLGESPRQILLEHGIAPVEMSGPIEMGLAAVYEGKNLARLKGRRNPAGGGCAATCAGGGTGCG
ncbi:MAG: radical SAM protein [Thermodesulfobacteriota bacterium]